MKHNLTDGNIAKKLILYFLPIAAGTILQQLYNAVDGIIVGKFVGTDVTLEKTDYKFVKLDDILAVVVD